MGLFNFYNKQRVNGQNMVLPDVTSNHEDIEIPRSLFIEENEIPENKRPTGINGKAADLEAIYAFLQADYETKGYSDAMTSPEDSYKKDNIMLFKQDLNILIQKVSTMYEDLIRDINFHISSRERAGLIDLVEELKTRKQTEEEHMRKVEEIRRDAENDQGMCQRMILSYQRGFMRGMAAITQTRFFNN